MAKSVYMRKLRGGGGGGGGARAPVLHSKPQHVPSPPPILWGRGAGHVPQCPIADDANAIKHTQYGGTKMSGWAGFYAQSYI